MIAYKYECSVVCSLHADLLFVADWTGLFASRFRIFLFLLEHVTLHFKRKLFVAVLELSELVDRRPALD